MDYISIGGRFMSKTAFDEKVIDEVVDKYNVSTNKGNLNKDGFAFSDHQPAFLEFKLI